MRDSGGSAGTKKLQFGLARRKADHSFEFEADSSQHGDGADILRRGDGHDPLQIQ